MVDELVKQAQESDLNWITLSTHVIDNNALREKLAGEDHPGKLLECLLDDAHAHTAINKDELTESSVCGCLNCLKLYTSKEVNEWTANGKSALCPYCSVDAVIGDQSGWIISEVFLKIIHDRFY